MDGNNRSRVLTLHRRLGDPSCAASHSFPAPPHRETLCSPSMDHLHFSPLNSDDSFGRVNRPCTRSCTGWQLKRDFLFSHPSSQLVDWVELALRARSSVRPLSPAKCQRRLTRQGHPPPTTGADQPFHSHTSDMCFAASQKIKRENMKRVSLETWSLSSGGEG